MIMRRGQAELGFRPAERTKPLVWPTCVLPIDTPGPRFTPICSSWIGPRAALFDYAHGLFRKPAGVRDHAL